MFAASNLTYILPCQPIHLNWKLSTILNHTLWYYNYVAYLMFSCFDSLEDASLGNTCITGYWLLVTGFKFRNNILLQRLPTFILTQSQQPEAYRSCVLMMQVCWTFGSFQGLREKRFVQIFQFLDTAGKCVIVIHPVLPLISYPTTLFSTLYFKNSGEEANNVSFYLLSGWRHGRMLNGNALGN